MHRKLADVEFVAFDQETTGLHPISCRILEFGAVRFRLDGSEIARFDQLVDPGCPIPPLVSRIHGITDAHVRGMPPVTEVLPRFLEFMGGADAILLAHNASFDLGFLAVAMAQCGMQRLAHRVLDTCGSRGSDNAGWRITIWRRWRSISAWPKSRITGPSPTPAPEVGTPKAGRRLSAAEHRGRVVSACPAVGFRRLRRATGRGPREVRGAGPPTGFHGPFTAL